MNQNGKSAGATNVASQPKSNPPPFSPPIKNSTAPPFQHKAVAPPFLPPKSNVSPSRLPFIPPKAPPPFDFSRARAEPVVSNKKSERTHSRKVPFQPPHAEQKQRDVPFKEPILNRGVPRDPPFKGAAEEYQRSSEPPFREPQRHHPGDLQA